MVLKMDNTYASAPQVGLGSADLVVEELVEGGMTRLAAFYYSEHPRRRRPGPLDARQRHRHRLAGRRRDGHPRCGRGDDQPDRGRRHPVLRRGRQGLLPRPSRQRAVQPVHRHVRDGRRWSTRTTPSAPDDYLPWGDEEDFPQGQPAKTIAARFSGGHTTNWTFDGGSYVNENTYAGAGDEFPADTVLVLRVKVGDAGYRDPAGNPVPETQVRRHRARR